MKDIIILYIWLACILPAAAILLFYCKIFKDKDGNTVVDIRNIMLLICGALIGNIGVVFLYLWGLGMWILVKLGEWGEKICDITLYDSSKVESKEKRRHQKDKEKKGTVGGK